MYQRRITKWCCGILLPLAYVLAACGDSNDTSPATRPTTSSFASSDLQQTTVVQFQLPERELLAPHIEAVETLINAAHIKVWSDQDCGESVYVEKRLYYRDKWNFESQLASRCDHYLSIKLGRYEPNLVDITEKQIDPAGPKLAVIYLETAGLLVIRGSDLGERPNLRIRIPFTVTDAGATAGFRDIEP